MSSTPDDDAPTPPHGGRGPRPYRQPDDERDGVGHRARTYGLEWQAEEAAPGPEIHDEISSVQQVQQRADQRLSARGVSDEIRLAVAEAVAVLVEHDQRGELRAANHTMAAAANRPVLVEVPRWWAPLAKMLPGLLAVITAIVTAALWLSQSSTSAERVSGDLRARIGQLEVDAGRLREEIHSLRASQERLWARLNPYAPVFPAMPGDSQ